MKLVAGAVLSAAWISQAAAVAPCGWMLVQPVSPPNREAKPPVYVRTAAVNAVASGGQGVVLVLGAGLLELEVDAPGAGQMVEAIAAKERMCKEALR